MPTELTGLDRPVSAYLRENVHYTFSGFNWTPAFLDLLLQVGSDRIMFSTDHPYASMTEARTFLDQLPASLPTRSGSPTATPSGSCACDRPTRQQKEAGTMSIVLPVFTPIEETLYLTLCGRALDNHLAQPILGDTMAEEVVAKLGYDCGRFRLSVSPIINIAHRAKKLDEVASAFIDRHPHAVGLDLGAGLDTRVFRIAPQPPWTGTTSTTPRSSPPAAAAPSPRQRPRHRRRPDPPGLAGRRPRRPAGGDRGRWPAGLPDPGRHGRPAGSPGRPFP